MIKRRTAHLAVAVATFLGTLTHSHARTIDPEQNAVCAAMAQSIVGALGAMIANRTDAIYFLAIGDFKDIHFICDRTNSLRQFDGIDISYNDGGEPPESWWTILGLAGAAYSGRTKTRSWRGPVLPMRPAMRLARSRQIRFTLNAVPDNREHAPMSAFSPNERTERKARDYVATRAAVLRFGPSGGFFQPTVFLSDADFSRVTQSSGGLPLFTMSLKT